MKDRQHNSNQTDQRSKQTNEDLRTSAGQDKRQSPPGPGQQQAQEVERTPDRSRTNIETDTDNDDGDRLRDPVSGDESDIERSTR